jgi:hypothetical protein
MLLRRKQFCLIFDLGKIEVKRLKAGGYKIETKTISQLIKQRHKAETNWFWLNENKGYSQVQKNEAAERSLNL